MTLDDDLTGWFEQAIASSRDESAALDDAYQQMENAGVISKVTVHRFLCEKGGHVLTTVIQIGDHTLARTAANKFSPGMNLQLSVPSARKKNTLDGNRHWPGHTYDVRAHAGYGDQSGMDMSCRHKRRTVLFNDVLDACRGTRPGHPGKPSRI